jgi:hypothetical protein
VDSSATVSTPGHQPGGQRVQVVRHRADLAHRTRSRQLLPDVRGTATQWLDAPMSMPAAFGNTSSSRLRIAMPYCSTIVDERQRHGKASIRLDLSNGMRLAPLTTVADDPDHAQSGLAPRRPITPRARTNDVSVMTALPFSL